MALWPLGDDDMVRLIALDLDDTLLTTDKQISRKNREALKACMDRGIRVVTASGRFNESQLDWGSKKNTTSATAVGQFLMRIKF